MIVFESVDTPWPVFVRDIARDQYGPLRAIGHGMVVGRRVIRGRLVLSYEVCMDDGTALSCTLEQFWNPENVAARMIRPAPLRIPAPPAYGARTCP
jgi:hypothetical protein